MEGFYGSFRPVAQACTLDDDCVEFGRADIIEECRPVHRPPVLNSALISYSECSRSQKQVAEFSVEVSPDPKRRGKDIKKRKRRSYKELDANIQMHCCPFPGCMKKYVGSYGRFNLQVHIKIKHQASQPNSEPTSPGTSSTVTMCNGSQSSSPAPLIKRSPARPRNKPVAVPESLQDSAATYFAVADRKLDVKQDNSAQFSVSAGTPISAPISAHVLQLLHQSQVSAIAPPAESTSFECDECTNSCRGAFKPLVDSCHIATHSLTSSIDESAQRGMFLAQTCSPMHTNPTDGAILSTHSESLVELDAHLFVETAGDANADQSARSMSCGYECWSAETPGTAHMEQSTGGMYCGYECWSAEMGDAYFLDQHSLGYHIP